MFCTSTSYARTSANISAINLPYRAGDEAGLGAQQELDDLCNFLWLSATIEHTIIGKSHVLCVEVPRKRCIDPAAARTSVTSISQHPKYIVGSKKGMMALTAQ
jgi:hypothetical protein